MTHAIKCPACSKSTEIESHDLPDCAADDLIVRCEDCHADIRVGWYAVVEVRGFKPMIPELQDDEDKTYKPLYSGQRSTWG